MEAARLASLLRYCQLEEFAEDAGVVATLEELFAAAEAYLSGAGAAKPSGAARLAQYNLLVNAMVNDSYTRRDATITGKLIAENPSFGRIMVQLQNTKDPE